MSVSNALTSGVLALLACTAQAIASEPDFARETRLAIEIVDAIIDGDPVWLEAHGREFLGIYTEAEDTGSAVLILHGRGFHPDWADTVNPLRVGLVEHGYATLSLQMPVLAKDAKYYDYIPILHYSHDRIEAGIGFLRDKGHSRVVLLAHSCGVHMAMSWIRTKPDASIDAFIGLGMGATDYRQPMHQAFPLDWMHVPVLDLYGSNDYPAVIRLAPRRLAMIEQGGHAKSRQAVLPGANHYYTDQGKPLVAAVADWLDQLD
ncbi:MAG: alpha/beta hydrolase family protein [Gammaproteobacteria bacterium]|nr:alpha/beta hydrolase family protein [Gammaproteobacteria bacterium]MDH3449496.1 alpha/beta hydrolase family protein [Gammaproteobacteria bacterium]